MAVSRVDSAALTRSLAPSLPRSLKPLYTTSTCSDVQPALFHRFLATECPPKPPKIVLPVPLPPPLAQNTHLAFPSSAVEPQGAEKPQSMPHTDEKSRTSPRCNSPVALSARFRGLRCLVFFPFSSPPVHLGVAPNLTLRVQKTMLPAASVSGKAPGRPCLLSGTRTPPRTTRKLSERKLAQAGRVPNTPEMCLRQPASPEFRHAIAHAGSLPDRRHRACDGRRRFANTAATPVRGPMLPKIHGPTGIHEAPRESCIALFAPAAFHGVNVRRDLNGVQMHERTDAMPRPTFCSPQRRRNAIEQCSPLAAGQNAVNFRCKIRSTHALGFAQHIAPHTISESRPSARRSPRGKFSVQGSPSCTPTHGRRLRHTARCAGKIPQIRRYQRPRVQSPDFLCRDTVVSSPACKHSKSSGTPRGSEFASHTDTRWATAQRVRFQQPPLLVPARGVCVNDELKTTARFNAARHWAALDHRATLAARHGTRPVDFGYRRRVEMGFRRVDAVVICIPQHHCRRIYRERTSSPVAVLANRYRLRAASSAVSFSSFGNGFLSYHIREHVLAPSRSAAGGPGGLCLVRVSSVDGTNGQRSGRAKKAGPANGRYDEGW
ncbi:hypothetical protein EVG20_g7804 [Dentipellis fragilis]|uniref:Uncharacterized protein n=1 Tax=Dentipellis fragilis TaxID=205917 RepID=A0A4Y9YBY1_9AGAM|nr:hypothetical protein EVG20_g7804 [Dentipellis fragilis]